MKIERPKQGGDPKTPKDIETQKFDKTEEFMKWEDDRDSSLEELKTLVSQGVAIPDFEKDGAGNIKSLTVRRLVDNEIIFYADNTTFEGREDIRKFME